MKNIKITFVALVILSLFLPGIINCLFKTEAPYEIFVAEWSAGEALNYTGTFFSGIFSAIATIVGVSLSIKYTKDNFDVERKERILPYLALNKIKVSYDSILKTLKKVEDAGVEAEDESYKEYMQDTIYIKLDSEKFTITEKIEPEDEKVICSGGFLCTSEDGRKLLTRGLLAVFYEIENVGIGAALDVSIEFGDLDNNTSCYHFYTLKIGQKIYLKIYSLSSLCGIKKNYIITIRYTDIFGNKYKQEYPCTFYGDKDNEPVLAINQKGIQIEDN